MAKCEDCARYKEIIRTYGATMTEIRKLISSVHDRPQAGGRSIADRGFRAT